MDYITHPREIEDKSMQLILNYLPQLKELPEIERKIIQRIVHTTGDPAIAPLIKIHPQAPEAGLAAIRQGAKVFTDVNMLLAGINGNAIAKFGMVARCDIKEPQVVAEAAKTGLTRAMVAMRLAGSQLDKAIICIGNAPTALFEVIKMIQAEHIKPALLIGTPVGFVGAAESKAEMVNKLTDVPWVTIEGTRGGSNIAVSVLNALLYQAGGR